MANPNKEAIKKKNTAQIIHGLAKTSIGLIEVLKGSICVWAGSIYQEFIRVYNSEAFGNRMLFSKWIWV